MEQKYFKCKHCGKLITELIPSEANLVCCGEVMEEVIAGTVEASKEKHIPVYKVEGNTVLVEVGEVLHPMQDVHYIEWIGLNTKEGFQVKYLKPGDAPKASFALTDQDEVISVVAHCNLHGLWKK